LAAYLGVVLKGDLTKVTQVADTKAVNTLKKKISSRTMKGATKTETSIIKNALKALK